MQKAVRIILSLITTLVLVMFIKMQNNRNTIERETAYHASLAKTILLKSDAFENGGQIPIEYTGKGVNTSPQLSWDSLPEGTKSLAIMVTDYDAPSPQLKMMIINHWALYNIPHSAISIAKGITKVQLDSLNIMVAKNYAGKNEYAGPRPIFGVHEYHFRIYALDFNSLFLKNSTRDELYKAMKGHILAYGELVGKF